MLEPRLCVCPREPEKRGTDRDVDTVRLLSRPHAVDRCLRIGGDPELRGRLGGGTVPDAEAMTLHLAEIATEIAPDKHAVLLLHQGRVAHGV